MSRERGRVCEPVELDQKDKGCPNRISTTRFTVITWLPKSLFLQFQRAANVYFAFVCCCVLFDFSPIMWSSTVIPFCAVLLWTALKDMYEDLRRKRDDDAENLRRCLRFDFAEKAFREARWRDVRCGDVLLSFGDEALPADVMLIYTCGGQAFISTVNLDGETNLKERRAAEGFTAITSEMKLEVVLQADKSFLGVQSNNSALAVVNAEASRGVSEFLEQDLEVTLAEPKAGLTELDGSFDLRAPSSQSSEVLSHMKVSMPGRLHFEHFIPRGCVLRNTPYIISMVAYCGGDTKTRLNVASTQAKISNMQVYLNRGVQGLVVTLFVFDLYAAIFSAIEVPEEPENWPRSWPAPIVRFIVYWIILYQIVPISLYVCFEIIKLILGFQINRDPKMVDPRTGVPALARTADLVEEMGQVNFVFSDKTGTLTENEMVFASCCIDGKDLGDFRAEVAPAKIVQEKPIGAGVEAARRILSNRDDPLYNEVRWFFLCMASCHSAQVEAGLDSTSKPRFNGPSPDEVCFLEAAHSVGITFESRRRLPGKSGWMLNLDGPAAEGTTEVEIFATLPFNSDRKRMTVILKTRDQMYCVCKGADNIMQPLCVNRYSEVDNEQLAYYSKLGLRTLVFASKTIDEKFYEAWSNRLAAAEMSSEGRDDAIAVVAAEMEHSLVLSGISAVEDKLQEGVPEAIVTIKGAGIRFWVLTGDKTETAVEIVRACRLFTQDMRLASLINCRSAENALELLQAAKDMLAPAHGDGGLVIDGTFVGHVLQSEQGSLMLYELAIETRACVCCRLSPQQKRKLVELVKKHNRRGITLAIGDGANDVSMIQGAHVGIGIRGKEGNQAVQASDVAISQFRFLVPLLLCHGRRAYRRVSVFLCYFLYKHIMLAVADMIWAHQCSVRFSGQTAYPEWMSAAYPLLLTAAPVMVLLGFDQDLPDEVVPLCPELYREGIERRHFNPRVFLAWMLTAVWHGCVTWLVPNLWVGSNAVTAHLAPDYEPKQFWRGSECSFVVTVIFVNVRLWLFTYSPFSWRTVSVMVFSFGMTLACLFGLSYTSIGQAMQPSVKDVAGTIFSEWRYLKAIVVTPVFLLVDISSMLFWTYVRPSPLDAARRRYYRGELVAPKVELKEEHQGTKDVPGEEEGPTVKVKA